jgi:hypothetical protein
VSRANEIPLGVVVGIKVGQEAGKLSRRLALVVLDVHLCRYGYVELTDVVHSEVSTIS